MAEWTTKYRLNYAWTRLIKCFSKSAAGLGLSDAKFPPSNTACVYAPLVLGNITFDLSICFSTFQL